MIFSELFLVLENLTNFLNRLKGKNINYADIE